MYLKYIYFVALNYFLRSRQLFMSLRDYGIICDNEVEYTADDEAIIVKFRDQFLNIKSKGYIKSHRSNNTGIGKTFEDLMSVKENNIPDVDFMNLIEIKTKRKDSESMLTLFTKSPDYPPQINTYLRDRYGMIDEKNNLKKLHTTISATKYNTFGDEIGFKLECRDDEEKIYILIHEQSTGKIIDHSVYYTYQTLRDIISKKCANVAYVSAESRINKDGIEEFKFTSVELLTGFTFEKFLKGVKSGKIKYDIRIGSYKSGKSYGKAHDHGSGFRIEKREIHSFFTVTVLN